MKTTVVRVSRSQRITTQEYVEVQIVQDGDDHAGAQRLAVDYIKACDAAGQDVDWETASEKAEKYPQPIYDSEIVSVFGEALVPETVEPAPRPQDDA